MKDKNKGVGFLMFLCAVGGGVFLFLIIFIILNYFNIISLQEIFYPGSVSLPPTTTIKQTGNGDNLRVIAKAGSENIYQSDIDREISSYPFSINEEAKKDIVEKVVKDSIILQAAKFEGWIVLDETVFNSQYKDYLKRVSLVADVKRRFENTKGSIEGSVVSIWFNNMKAGAVGYEKGKEIARDKITALQADVKSRKITIYQAAQEIINDKSLAQVDESYAANAIFNFNVGSRDSITFDPVFDDLIRGLPVGGITDVYLAKSKVGRSEKLIDSVYMFAQVVKDIGGKMYNFDQWYIQKEKNYEVIYY